MPLVLKLAIPGPLRRLFDYLPPASGIVEPLQAGMRLWAPFSSRKTVGYLVSWEEIDAPATRPLKAALAFLDTSSLLGAQDVRLLDWTAGYYHHPLGEVFAAAFPAGLRKGGELPARKQRLCLTETGQWLNVNTHSAPRQKQLLQMLQAQPQGLSPDELNVLGWDWRRVARLLVDKGWICFREESGQAPLRQSTRETPQTLNPAQQVVVERVEAALNHNGVFLLDGVTGSGKTEVYLRLSETVLAQGRQVMMLLPEINLTPQLEARFRQRFHQPVAVFHSGLGDAERCRAWLGMQRGETAILLGTRSAVFTPMARPGLIILDEEHDLSFKQQEGLRFSARDVALMRARLQDIPIVLGTATPSLETLANARRGRYVHLHLPERAGDSRPPQLLLQDIRAASLREGLSPGLIALLRQNLERGEQSLLFLNRRGYAPTLICHSCGWIADCQHCDAHLVMHAGDRRLRCHHCGHEQKLAEHCPQCGTRDLRPLGLGTERVEQALTELFPNAKLARIDRDSTRRKGSLERALGEVHSGEVEILLGTQMLAKGHHFPGVTLVGILDVDAGLYSLDFRSAERLAQLIVQVAGRSGRGEKAGRVLLQTHHPEHPLLGLLLSGGYPAFAEAALAERRAARLPPYTHLALWRAEAQQADLPLNLLNQLKTWTLEQQQVQVLGPATAPRPRVAGQHRYHLLLQCERRAPLHRLITKLVEKLEGLAEARKVRWSVDVDPLDAG